MRKRFLPGDIRQRIRDLAGANQVTQEQLAVAIGVTCSKLSRFLNRKSEVIEPDVIVRIARYFGVSTDCLLGMTDAYDEDKIALNKLHLSLKVAKKLCTGELDAGVVNQLLEHPAAGWLTQLIRHGQRAKDTLPQLDWLLKLTDDADAGQVQESMNVIRAEMTEMVNGRENEQRICAGFASMLRQIIEAGPYRMDTADEMNQRTFKENVQKIRDRVSYEMMDRRVYGAMFLAFIVIARTYGKDEVVDLLYRAYEKAFAEAGEGA